MTFQAYLDTIKAKTGLDPDDFQRLAAEKGMLADDVKPAAIIAWLKTDYDLGPGHAMAIVSILGKHKNAGATNDDKIAGQFAGAKAGWRPAYDRLLATLREHGPLGEAATNSYISLLKGTKKFAIVQCTADRMDIGIKLKSEAPTERFELAGNWNAMVTHRVRVANESQLDPVLFEWLCRAYDAA